jgi:hypothetical protein
VFVRYFTLVSVFIEKLQLVQLSIINKKQIKNLCVITKETERLEETKRNRKQLKKKQQNHSGPGGQQSGPGDTGN